jgi:hypothetical protein
VCRVRRYADPRQRRVARLEGFTRGDETAHNRVRVWTADAHHTDAAAPGRRRDRHDGVGGAEHGVWQVYQVQSVE